MTLEQIVALAIRLFSIILAIYAIRNGLSLVPLYYDQELHVTSYLYATLMVFLLFVAIGLWHFPLTITRKLVTFQEPGKTDISTANSEQIQAAALTVLGLYFLFSVISDLVYWGTLLFITQRNPELNLEISLEQKGLIVATFVELLFSLFLLLGSNQIVEMIRRFRYGNDA